MLQETNAGRDEKVLADRLVCEQFTQGEPFRSWRR